MAQKNIDFGSYPDDPDADAIRTAFQKTQQNFSEIFAGLSDTGVQSINKTKQPGITVSAPTGNVLISADFACLTVQSSTLALTVSNGSPASTQVISNSSQVLQINVPNTLPITNANLSGNLSVNGWANIGNSTSNVIINGGNIAVTGELTANSANINGNINIVGNIANANNISVTNNLSAVVGTFTGNITALNANLGNLVTANYVNVAVDLNANGNIKSGNANLGNAITGNYLTINNDANIVGNLSAGNISGGNLVSANFVSGTLTTNAQPNITSVGTLTSLDVNGNITAANITANTGVFTGNGIGLTNLAGANVTGQVGNALVAGTVYTNAQPNITSVGTLTSLSVTGNITSGNVYANSGTIGANLLTGTLTTANQSNITTIGTLGSLNVTNKVTAGQLQGDGGNISNVQGSNISGSVSSANTASTVTTAAQPNITSVGTLSSLSVTGNLSAGNANLGNLVQANYIQGDGSLLTNIAVTAGTYISSGTSNVAIPAPNGNVTVTVGATNNLAVFTSTGANINGTLDASNNISAPKFIGNLEGAVLTNAQTNITSLGTLTGLTVNGVSNLGSNSNVIITGGSANSFLMTNGSGNLSWNTATLVPAQGSNTQIIYNDGGNNYAGNTGFTFNKTSGNVAIPGALSVVGNISGDKITGTLTTANQPNITEIGTLSYLIVNGNINAGNISGNVMTANSFVGNGSSLSGLAGANVSGQVSNALVAGTVYTAAQPNITSVGTLTSLGVNGNITGSNIVANTGAFYGNGSGITSLNATQITTGTLAQARLANASVTLGNTALTLGATVTTITGLASVTSTTFVGSLTGAATTAGTVSTASQPNITSVGTLTSVTSSGNASAANVIATGYHIRSVGTSISAAGTVQGNATALTNEFNQVTTVASGAGVRLPTAVAGMAITITNISANSLNVYPATSAAINSLSANAAFVQGAGSTLQFIAMTSTQWYTVGATYA
jgi:hypothetical protein